MSGVEMMHKHRGVREYREHTAVTYRWDPAHHASAAALGELS